MCFATLIHVFVCYKSIYDHQPIKTPVIGQFHVICFSHGAKPGETPMSG